MYPIQSTARSDILWLLGRASRLGWKSLTRQPYTPPVLNFLVTYRCDLRCRHCFFWEMLDSKEHPELELDEVKKISASMGPLFSLVLSGGEPFLRKDLPQIAKIFHDQNQAKILVLLTDGQATQRILASVDQILELCPETLVIVGVSIDGIGPIHNEIRQKHGAFEKAITTFKSLRYRTLKEPRLAVQTCTVLMRLNQDHIFPLYHFIRDELCPDRITINLIRQDPLDPTTKGVDTQIYLRLIRTIQEDTYSGRLRNRFGFDRFCLATVADLHMMDLIYKTIVTCRPRIRCYAGVTSGVLLPDGSLYPCEFRDSLGNLRDHEYDVKRIWFPYSQAIFKDHARKGCFCTHEIDCFLPSLAPNLSHYPSLVSRWFKIYKGQARMQVRPCRLSIIIPTLNEAPYIGNLLECLSRQTFKDFEVIVVDGGSQDTTREIVTTYQEQLPSLKLMLAMEEGSARTRNTGARTATGDDLVFMDARGIVEDTFLADLAREMRRRGLKVASTLSRPVSTRWLDQFFYRAVLGLGLRILQFFFPIVSGACIAVTREIFDAVGGFNETIYFEDAAFVKQAAKKGRFRILKGPHVTTSGRRLEANGSVRAFWKLILFGFFRRLLLGEKPLDKAFTRLGNPDKP